MGPSDVDVQSGSLVVKRLRWNHVVGLPLFVISLFLLVSRPLPRRPSPDARRRRAPLECGDLSPLWIEDGYHVHACVDMPPIELCIHAHASVAPTPDGREAACGFAIQCSDKYFLEGALAAQIRSMCRPRRRRSACGLLASWRPRSGRSRSPRSTGRGASGRTTRCGSCPRRGTGR